jgi:glycosyltransferase 2 family protein
MSSDQSTQSNRAIVATRPRIANWRAAKLAMLIVCALLTGWIVWSVGITSLLATLRSVGWRPLWAISLVHLVAVATMGVAWWQLLRVGNPLTYIWGRMVRDAGSDVVPLTKIGSGALGVRTAALSHDLPVRRALASILVDTTNEFGAQIVFTAIGIAFLLRLEPGTSLALPLLIGLCVAIAAAGGFVALQTGSSALLSRISSHHARGPLQRIHAVTLALRDEVRAIYCSRMRIVIALLLHLGAWLLSASEAWLALRLMGVTISASAVLIIESLVYAVRGIAFMVPGSIGIQEGAYIALGAAFGLSPSVALTLSLVKRGRDFLIGIPALASWQIVEARHGL